MHEALRSTILKATSGSSCQLLERIQDLWGGYGVLARYKIDQGVVDSVIVKHIVFPTSRPSGKRSRTAFSDQRKRHSYHVEVKWYQSWSNRCGNRCYTPKCFGVVGSSDEISIVLEDLDAVGFPMRYRSRSVPEMKPCLRWLAHFHATFLGESPDGLWEKGTYWHLDTRPEELAALKDVRLKNAAAEIDARLDATRFKTIVHGDAKLANFCFSPNGKNVAAVDYQYVGGGCGMKDVAYFIGSCLDERGSELHHEELLTYYFDVLCSVVRAKRTDINAEELELEWRSLFPFAWVDFHRFYKGWTSGRWDKNSYSERLTESVLVLVGK